MSTTASTGSLAQGSVGSYSCSSAFLHDRSKTNTNNNTNNNKASSNPKAAAMEANNTNNNNNKKGTVPSDDPTLREWKQLADSCTYVLPPTADLPSTVKKRCTYTTIDRLLEKLFAFCQQRGIGVYHQQHQMPKSFATFGLILETPARERFSLLIWYATKKRDQVCWELNKVPSPMSSSSSRNTTKTTGMDMDVSHPRAVSLDWKTDDDTTTVTGLNIVIDDLFSTDWKEDDDEVDHDVSMTMTNANAIPATDDLVDHCLGTCQQLWTRLQEGAAVQPSSLPKWTRLQELLGHLTRAVETQLPSVAHVVLPPKKRPVTTTTTTSSNRSLPMSLPALSSNHNKRQRRQAESVAAAAAAAERISSTAAATMPSMAVLSLDPSPNRSSSKAGMNLLARASTLPTAMTATSGGANNNNKQRHHLPDRVVPALSGLLASQQPVLNKAELHVKQYQAVILEAKGDLRRTLALVDEMYLTGAPEMTDVRDMKGSGCKRYIQRAYRVARCLHVCFRGNQHAFCEAFPDSKLVLPNYKCPHGLKHHKIKGEDERLIHLPPGGIPTSKPALQAAVQRMSPKDRLEYLRIC